jgi:hypothetical protein
MFNSPNEFMHMPIENLLLEELPDCQNGFGGRMGDSESDTFFDDGNTNNLSFWYFSHHSLNSILSITVICFKMINETS